MLSDYAGTKIKVACECGLKKQYDASAMLARLGDRKMPELLDDIAIACGCDKAKPDPYDGFKVTDRCQAVYAHIHFEDPRFSRTMRPSTGNRRPNMSAARIQSPWGRCRNGIISTDGVPPASISGG